MLQSPVLHRWMRVLGAAALVCALATVGLPKAQAQEKKPNILVIMGDDIGFWNISVWNRGMMGFQTPNIDRIANEGALFSTYYGQQSCTAGRAAFITGQAPFRTGLTKVGLPGSPVGLQKEDPTIADMLKPLGYTTAQFGKNHLGDRDEFLPTAHGFDEFFGNLYHLNAEEEPKNPDYPKDPEFRKKFGPRGVLQATADGKIDDTGPLTRKRMETVDEEFLAGAKDFIERQVRANKPFFVWFNSTRMHIFTHLKPASQGKTGLGIQGDGMVEHDGHVGELLKLLDDLKVADNTIVIYTTDNGAMKNMWPDGGISPFRSEKDTNWEGAVRVPCFARWPGVIKPGTIINGLFSAEDWLPTLVAAAGDMNIKEKLLKGHTAGTKTFKVHLDGYNQVPLLKGEVPAGYYTARANTHLLMLAARALPAGGDMQGALDAQRRIKIYPLSQSANPPAFAFLDRTDQKIDVTLLRWEDNLQYWENLHKILQEEPVVEEFRPMYGLLAALGIEQGKPFAPDARMKAILECAAKAGRDQMLVAGFGSSRPDRLVWNDRKWEWAARRYENGDFELPTGIDVEARDRWFSQAVGVSPKMLLRTAGAGSLYWLGLRDKDSAYLDGGKTYKLSVTQPVPQKLFWSVTVYDSGTRSQIQTDQDKAALRSLVELKDVAQTGATDLYFGPTAPAGKEGQWIKTHAGKGWFVYFRLYGPEGPAFDGRWKPGDFEAVQ